MVYKKIFVLKSTANLSAFEYILYKLTKRDTYVGMCKLYIIKSNHEFRARQSCLIGAEKVVDSLLLSKVIELNNNKNDGASNISCIYIISGLVKKMGIVDQLIRLQLFQCLKHNVIAF